MIEQLRNTLESRSFWVSMLASLSIVAGFFLWIESDTNAVARLLYEDGPVENATAFLFGVSSAGFLIFMARSDYLRSKGRLSAYLLTASWAFLMFVFMGEEISWGQRIFGFETPEAIAEVNLQDEFNVHNIGVVNTFLGGKYRYLSIMMILTGVVFPLLAHTPWFGALVQRFAFPVSPLGYWPVFLGAYVLGKYYAPGGWSASEVRELILAIGMCLFAFHGVFRPRELFYLGTESMVT